MSNTSPEKILEALRTSLKETERLRKENRRIAAASREPIAIVAIGCRFPGGVTSPEGLWSLLDSGTDAVSGFPTDRGWDEDLYDPDPTRHGKTYVREGAFLEGVTDFDPGFFGISPREALAMDPQHRLLLETSWEALERAGISPQSLKGSRTGVFAGTNGSDYGALLQQTPEGLEGYLGTGRSGAVLSGRVSYFLGLEGPAVTVDTACSSSLVTLHLAAQSLRNDECTLALAGGVTLMTTPGAFVEFSRQGALSPSGRCRPFSDAADGTAWGEGAGVLVLERLSDARRNGHPVLAVVRGSAVNQDGASNGLTAPNGPSQQRVIRAALADARVSAADVDAVEAHGTGTTLGDPIEAQALLATYGQDRPADRPLWLGSLKSNIGHSAAAAGVGGVIKMVLAMRHGVLPKSLHVGEPSSEVDWSAGAVEVLAEARDWPAVEGRPRRAGVSSFGVSGTNAHVIIEQAPELEPAPEVAPAVAVPAVVPWVLSGRGAEGLRGQAAGLSSRVEGDAALFPVDVGWSLAAGRAEFDHRAVVIGGGLEELAVGAAGLARGESVPGVVVGPGAVAGGGRVAVLFSGQGSQRVGMGRELYERFPVFAAAFDEVCAVLDRELSGHVVGGVREVVFGEGGAEGALDETVFTQAGLFAVEWALFRLVESWGVRPEFVGGHSIGELVAACVAGVWSLEDAARLVAARGRLMQALPVGGAMVAVQASEADVVELLADYGSRVSVAAVNGPSSVVVSGDEDVVVEVAAALKSQGRKTKRLVVSHAFHSPRMDAMLEEFREVAKGLTYGPPRMPVVSNVTGTVATPDELCSPEYWVRHVRGAVRFADGAQALRTQGVSVFVELGPEGVLSAMGAECVPDGVFVPVLRSGRGEERSFIAGVARAWTHGVPVDWTRAFEGTGASRVDLPTYAFQRQRYWLENGPQSGGDVTSVGLAFADHPLLGAAVDLAGRDGAVYTARLSLKTHPWLADHRIGDVVVLPGSALVDVLTHVGEHVNAPVVDELDICAPITFPAAGSTTIQLSVDAPEADERRRPVRVHSRITTEADTGTGTGTGTGIDRDGWTEHATATLAVRDGAWDEREAHTASDLASWPPRNAVERTDLTLPGVRAVWESEGRAYADLCLPESAESGDSDRYGVHPAVLETALRLTVRLGLVPDLSEVLDPDASCLAHSWSTVRAYAKGASSLRVRLTPTGPDTVAISAADDTGAPVLDVGAVALRAFSPQALPTDNPYGRDALFEVEWVRAASGSAAAADDRCSYADLADGRTVPSVVVFEPGAGDPDGSLPERVHAVGQHVLEVLQQWLAEPKAASSRLVVATATSAGTDDELVAESIRGLVRSAQSENPGRFVLLETDRLDEETLRTGLAATGATGADEPRIAVREGRAHVPRLRRAVVPALPATDLGLADGAVLVTGATGGLGRLVTRHLVETHGVTELVLVSRSGRDEQWADELEALGASVRMVAADVADREAMAAVVDSLGDRLIGVVHTAGIVDDAVVATMEEGQWHAVLRPKVDAAWHLHELTAGLDLRAFVLFSAAASPFGGAGQGNYAAANAFLDALAAHRHTLGLPAVSMAWGLWGPEIGGMGGRLGDTDLTRMARLGILPISAEQGLALFDAGLVSARPTLVPVRLDLPALRDNGQTPALLRSLVPSPVRRAVTSGDAAASTRTGTPADALAHQLTGLAPADRHKHLLDLVRDSAATVLGYASAHAIDAHRPFKDVGFDSLTAVELRNHLAATTGLTLSATLVFDYATPTALAQHLSSELPGATDGDAGAGRTVAGTPSAPAAATDDDPIVIVGMGCRFPGGANSPEELWQLLASGGDAVTEFPQDRGWDMATLFDPDPDRIGKSYVREGSFLEGVADFDPGFFGIAPREALAMDPQQRLLLETSWEAIERAGIDPSTLRGSRTGVFAGTNGQDYSALLFRSPNESDGYLATGISASVVSGRLSYTFGLEGPAVSVDTACSSSLVTLHLAAQALRAGECTLALAGGVTVMSTPGLFVEFSRQRALSSDGRCRAFSDAANGTGWGEGAGMVLLERLSDARRNGHPVLAVVRGSAVNQDGASNGLTAPNGPAQQRVIRAALANAGVSAADVDVVEAHGTATTLGDPIEAQALLATYGQERPAERPLYLGSLKSNIGHTQAAAGVAGVIKMVQALRHGIMPESLHVGERSSKVDWSAGAVELLSEAREWVPGAVDRVRRAGVSSFGVSGTNAHVILEQAPDVDLGVEVVEAAPVAVPWVVSGRGAEAVRDQAGRLASLVESGGVGLSPVDVGWSLAAGRAEFENRAVVIGGALGELASGIGALRDGLPASGLVEGVVSGSGGRVVFVFPGQGSQWAGMAVDLLDSSPVFAGRMAECGRALAEFVDWDLEAVVRQASGAPSLERVDVVQPVSWAVMVSLAELWQSFGVKPSAVVGHSQGEIAAACVAGGLSLQDGARVVALRSQAIAGSLAGFGGMMSVALPLAEVESRLVGWAGRLEVAALNGPTSTVVAGEPEALDELLAACEAEGVRARRVAVDYASHTSHVERIEGELAEVLARVQPMAARVPFFSTVEGDWLDTTTLDAGYWYRNLRQTVRFQGAIEDLVAQGHGTFIEVSAHPVLTMSVQDQAESAVVAGTLRRNEGGLDRFYASLAEVWVQGVDVDWAGVFEGTGASRVELPTYAFQRRRYWLDAGASATGDMASVGLLPADHPFLGAAIELPGSDGIVLTGRLSAQAHAWLPAHGAEGAALLPATAFVEMALRAGDEVGCDVVDELTLQAPLVLPAQGGAQLRVRAAEPDWTGRRKFSVHSRTEAGSADAPWVCHATGVLTTGDGSTPAWDLVSWPPAGAVAVESEELDGLWQGADGDVFAEVSLPGADEQQGEAARYGLHPALFDAALDAARVLASAGEDAGPNGPWLPSSWQGVSLHAVGAAALRVRITATGRLGAFSIALADATGAPVASVEALALTPPDAAWPGGDAVGAPEKSGRPATRRSGPRRTAAPAGATGTAGGADLRRRLAGLAEADRTQLLSDLVRAETAVVLGHPGPETVDLHRGFFEQGFNSLMSVDLRNRLGARTGLRLPTGFLFEYTKPTSVVAHLQKVLTGPDAADGFDTAGGPATSGTRAPAPAAGIEAMFRQAHASGQHTAGNELIMAASSLRTAFDSGSAAEHLPEPVRLAVGPARPTLFCLPAVVATAGPQQYTRFAEHFRDRRDVTVVPQPGYLEGESIPADMAALVELHAQALVQAAGDDPFVLVGHSAGGQIAHAVTAHLEVLGSAPVALVLLDVPWPDDDEVNNDVGVAMLGVVFDREAKLGGGIMNDTRLSAMGGYHRILGGWRPEPIKTPTLLVRATEPMWTSSGDPEHAHVLHIDWKLEHTAREVASDHFGIVEEHAEATARVVEAWLDEMA
ncbi:SDR family NAD(P)-dependent oxidoreductase [Streptomyces sp. NPDC098789]|uniref:SDR family NAD(P)-dependent oxidoreductase n=1 Tax=Streptomyces sp. NPDC098789 TaxID=3366098 RepID=UPI003810339B